MSEGKEPVEQIKEYLKAARLWFQSAGLISSGITIVGLVFFFNTLAFASFHIPSESMVPTLEVGDRVIVTKYPYGYSKYSVPFGLAPHAPGDGRILASLPQRGDVVVFKHSRNNDTMIKRVIGLPGDRIQLDQERLYINGEKVDRELVREFDFIRHKDKRTARVREYIETLPGGVRHTIFEVVGTNYTDSTQEFVVPPDHLFMLGDNRAMSWDSRDLSQLGYVPVENLKGRAEIISFSLHKCKENDTGTCGFDRYFSRLR